MKRSNICLGLIVALGLVDQVLPQDRDPAAAREESTSGDRPQDGNRPREAGERPREGLGFGRGEGGPMGRGEFGPGRMLARLPIMVALDADQDGEISSNEIDMAVVALKKLDKNRDGKLTMDEMMPSFEGGMGPGGFAGGPGGPGAAGGFGGGPGGFFGGGSPQEMVTRLMEGDKDNDGYLSESELPERMREVFMRADIDGDSKLSRDEITLAQRQMQAGGRGGRGVGAARREGPGGRPASEGEGRPQRPEKE